MQLKIKSLIFVLALAISVKLNAQISFPNNGPADTRPNYIALLHVNVQVDPKNLLMDASLVIKDGKIEALGKGIDIPNNARKIDGKGAYIYPSFIDLYSNYGIKMPSAQHAKTSQYSNNNKGAYTWNDAVKPEINAVDYFEYDEKRSKYYLSAGFGTTLSSVQDGIFRGTSTLVLTGKNHEQKLVLRAKAANGMSFNKGSSKQDYPGSAMGSVALIRQTYYDAQWYQQQKVQVNIGFENLWLNQGLPVVFEAENKLAILRAARIGKEFNKSYVIKGNGDEYQRIEEIAATQLPIILPINFPKPFEVEDPYDAMNINLGDLKHWEMAPANLAIVKSKKIAFAITATNCSDASTFLKNLRKAVAHGLSKEDALEALTQQPAKLLNMEKEIGALKPGMLANFFMCSEPLFEKDAQIESHWILGEQLLLKPNKVSELIGTYTMNYLGMDTLSVLEVLKKNGITEAKIMGKDTLKVSIKEQGEIYNFTFKENKKSEKLLRANVWIESLDSTSKQITEMRGNVWLANGEIQKITFKRTLVQTEKKKTDSATNYAIGKVIFPFTEYGNEVLPKAENIVFKGATVWTNEKDSILFETDVAVSNGKIVAIGKGLNLAGAKMVDAKGKFLTSGIIDEHSHIGIYRGVNECTQNNTAEVRIGDVVNSEDINIYRQLSGGVVACQQLHGSCNPIGGQSSLIKLRWGKAPEEMKIAQADGFIKFALGENVKQSNRSFGWGRYPETRMGVEQVYYDAFIRAREYEAEKKANPKLNRTDLEMETMLEILNKKRFISCHSYVQSEINMLMHVADSMKFTVNTFTHILEGYKVADKMKAHGANASTFADWWAYKYEVIEAIPHNAAILNYVGIVTAINSDDAEMGRRLNQEAAKIIKYGHISEMDAWKMVTLNPAKMLHIDKQTGSIKIGKDADLVLWSANPLSIDAKAEMTLVDGICYFSRTQDLVQRKAIEQERMRIIQKMILAKQNGDKTEHKVSEIDPDYHCEDY
ncbi:MAG: amidohydrolase family protein [bacterium]|nr:amidohydrolase family protein [bacterium]